MLIPSILSPGAFGKIPAFGDFVRINITDSAALQLASWLQEGLQAVLRAGSALPPGPTCFLLSIPPGQNILVGAFAPSRDLVGRVFPLSIFVPVEPAPLATEFPLVPLAFNRFLSAAAALLESAPTISAADLQRRVSELPSPQGSDWTFAHEQRWLRLDGSSASFMNQFAESSSSAPHYAMRTFTVACAGEKAQEPAKTRIVLDCPLSSEGPLPWLELAARLLNWKSHPPSFLWTNAPPARLLLALGPAPAAAVGYLAKPESSIAMFWPLRTSQKSAMDTAKQALSEDQRRVLDQAGGSLEGVLAAFAR